MVPDPDTDDTVGDRCSCPMSDGAERDDDVRMCHAQRLDRTNERECLPSTVIRMPWPHPRPNQRSWRQAYLYGRPEYATNRDE